MRDTKPVSLGSSAFGGDPLVSSLGSGNPPSGNRYRPAVRSRLLLVLLIVVLAAAGVWYSDTIGSLFSGSGHYDAGRRTSARRGADGWASEESSAPAEGSAPGAVPRRSASGDRQVSAAGSGRASRATRDPNIPLEWPPLNLQGIIAGRLPEHSTALINGQSVKIGGTVDGVRVQAIHTNRVDLVMEGTVRTLYLGQRR